jgi:hypothetical protein
LMDIEKNLIIALLKLTRKGPVSHDLINKDARIPSETAEKLLQRLQSEGLVYLRESIVEIDAMQRLKLAVRAIGLGVDVERVSGFLQWQEFEGLAAVALERNGYSVSKNVRFAHVGHRWEIDIVGCRYPWAVCIDCKHWHKSISPSVLKNVVQAQVDRSKALAESLPNPAVKIACITWIQAKFIPVVLSLVIGKFKFLEGVPIVPILQLQDFLNQLPIYAHSLAHFSGSGHKLQYRFSGKP